MWLALLTSYAFSVWIVWASLGLKSFDGLLLGVTIVLIGFAVSLVRRRIARSAPAE
jgi:hypothetical protein